MFLGYLSTRKVYICGWVSNRHALIEKFKYLSFEVVPERINFTFMFMLTIGL